MLDQLAQSGEIPTIGTYTPPVVDLRAEAARRGGRSVTEAAGTADEVDEDAIIKELEEAESKGRRASEG